MIMPLRKGEVTQVTGTEAMIHTGTNSNARIAADSGLNHNRCNIPITTNR